MGLETDGVLAAQDFGKILDGHLEEGFEVGLADHLIIFLLQLSHGGLVPGKRGYNVRPTESERMHCIAFVISAMGVSAMDPDIVKKFKDIRKEARDRGAAFSLAQPTPSQIQPILSLSWIMTKPNVDHDPALTDLTMTLSSFRFASFCLGLHPIVILTKVDVICKWTEEDTRLVFNSREVLEKASFQIGSPFYLS